MEKTKEILFASIGTIVMIFILFLLVLFMSKLVNGIIYPSPTIQDTYFEDGYNFVAYYKNQSGLGETIKYCINTSETVQKCLTYQPLDMSYIDANGGIDYISNINNVYAVMNNSILTYPEAFPGVDLTYEVKNNSMKENFVIKTKPRDHAAWMVAPITLNFGGYISYDNDVTMWDNETEIVPGKSYKTNNKIEFKYNGTTIYELPKPYMTGSGENDSIGEITYEIKKQGNQIWFYTKVPIEYLNSSNFTYPLMVDPTVASFTTAYSTNTDQTYLGTQFGSTKSFNISFDVDTNVDKISIKTGVASNDIKFILFKLVEDNGTGFPSATLVNANSTANVTHTGNSLITANFLSNVTLTANTQYHVILQPSYWATGYYTYLVMNTSSNANPNSTLFCQTLSGTWQGCYATPRWVVAPVAYDIWYEINGSVASTPDTTPPTWTETPVDLTLDNETALAIQYNATDDVEIDQYWMNNLDYCYQETANESTSCGGLSTGSYSYDAQWVEDNPPNNTYDGNWSTYDQQYCASPPFDCTAAALYINYSKPLGALNTSIWQVLTSTNFANMDNYSIPQLCWEQEPLQLKMKPDGIGGATQLSCYNGTAFYVFDGSPAANVAEEAMFWDIQPFEINSTGYFSNISTLAEGNYSVNISVNDTSNNTNSAAFWVNVTNIEADPCAKPTSPNTDWIIDMADNCVIENQAINLGTGSILYSGSGTLTFNTVNLFTAGFNATDEGAGETRVITLQGGGNYTIRPG